MSRAMAIALLVALPVLAYAQGIPGSPGTVFPVTDRSGTITVGALAQTLAPARARHGCFVQNQSNSDLWVGTVTALPLQPSVWLPAGSSVTCDVLGTPPDALSIYGAGTGQAFAAREW